MVVFLFFILVAGEKSRPGHSILVVNPVTLFYTGPVSGREKNMENTYQR